MRFADLLFYLSLPSLQVNGPFGWKIETKHSSEGIPSRRILATQVMEPY